MRHEDILQRDIVSYLRLAVPNLLVFSIPNFSRGSYASTAALKATGMLPGIPDLCLVQDGGQAFFLEVKTPKGRMSEHQKALVLLMVVKNIQRATVRSISDVEVALKAWRLL